MSTHNVLIILPLLIALVMPMSPRSLRNFLSMLSVLVLGSFSIINIAYMNVVVEVVLSDSLHTIFMVVDFIILFFFLWQGIIKKDNLVSVLAIIQTILFIFVLLLSPTLESSDIIVDRLSSMMYLIINIVGGIIILFALKYIESEEFGRFKKNGFIALLFFFLFVMNFIVSANNIEMFFLLFELTTLCSYLLIAYRGDKLSIENSLRALWMNQIGGVAILIALIFSIYIYDTIYFDILVSNIQTVHLIPIVLLIIAAFVKGASIPFDKWLLGAMVAPTPVSAILHSATMVKIAPYLIVKLSPAMSGFVSVSVTLISTFVFFAAALLALSKDYFKEILGLSTIALLALMMGIAAIGTDMAINAALILMMFHAISKALLFLQAGILEKSFHLKYVDDINSLVNHSPLVVFFIIIGFASLTLPPFGAFIGKFIAIESISKEIINNPLYALSLVFIALGSTFLTLLYFKVVTKLFAKDIDLKVQKVKISRYYTIPSYMLVGLLAIGIYFSFELNLLGVIEILIPLVLIAIVPVLFFTLLFKKAHRIKEYNCGEKDEVELGMYYFHISPTIQKLITSFGIIGILILIAGVLL